MKLTKLNMMLAATSVLGIAPAVRAELTTAREARTIAENYVDLVLANEGNWGGGDSAAVVSVQEFRRGNRIVGYFFPVVPQGFVVISLHRELPPVKAYSSRADLSPQLEGGLTDLLKGKMECILDALEQRLGRPLDPSDRFGDLLEIDYSPVTAVLIAEDFDPQAYCEPRRARSAGMNYQEGEELLTANWHQQPPFNHHCPDMGCGWPDYGGFNQNARVGCVATAGAQVMYHWRWPPAGHGFPYDDAYDWPNMCDAYSYDGAGWFNDQDGDPVSWAQINAVAELCVEVGMAASMDWGCDGSSTPTWMMEDVFESIYRYDDCFVRHRKDYDALEWFTLIKEQVSANRLVQYRVDKHAIVCDGWNEEWIDGKYHWFHMNYGWPVDSYDAWYALDALHLADLPNEYCIVGVVPEVAIGGILGAFYAGGTGVWRYFDLDSWGTNTTFGAGQYLQVLRSRFILGNPGSPTDAMRVYGAPGLETRFFLYGDPVGKTRLLIQDGALKIRGGGQIVIR